MLARRGFQSTTRAAAVAGAVRHLTTRDDRRVGAAPMERRPVHEGDTEQLHKSTSTAGVRKGNASAAVGPQPLQQQQFSFEDYEARRFGTTTNAAAAATAVHQRRLLATVAPPPPPALPMRGLSGSRFNTGSLLMSPEAVAAAERNRANQMNPMHALYWMSRGFAPADAARRAQMAGVGASTYMGARQPARRQLGALFSGAAASPIQVMSVPAELRAINALRRRRILRRAFAPPVATGADYRPGAPKRATAGKKKFAIAKPSQKAKAASAKPVKMANAQIDKTKPSSPLKAAATASKLTHSAKDLKQASVKKGHQLKLHKKAALKKPNAKSLKMTSKANKLKAKPHAKADAKKSGNTVASALASVVAKRQKKLLLQEPSPLNKAAKKALRNSRLDLKAALAHSTLRARRDPAHPAYWLQQGYELPEATEAAAKYTGRRERAPAMMKKPLSAATKNRRTAGALREALEDQQWLLSTIY